MLLTDDFLLNYKRCRRRTYLDTYGDLTQQDSERDFVAKLRDENQLHVNMVLEGLSYSRIQSPEEDYKARAEETLLKMQESADYIYKGVLYPSSLHNLDSFLGDFISPTPSLDWEKVALVASPTLLVKQPGQSKFGDWQYVPVSIKLGRRPKPEYQIVAAFQALLLAGIQGEWSKKAQIILRSQNTYSVNLKHWIPRMQEVLAECLQMLQLQNEPEVFISRQRCGLCQWYSHCRAIAQSTQHLSLIPGVTPTRYESLQEMGITSLESLANAHFDLLSQAVTPEVAPSLQQQAQAIFYNKPLLSSHRQMNLTIPTAPIELYFDIEAEPERNLDYLLGVLVVNREQSTEQFHSFMAEKPEEERDIWEQFLDFVNQYPTAPIFHYSKYEVETIKRLGKLYCTPRKQIEEIVSRLVDVHRCVMASVTLPVENYSLKTLANWLGFEWRDSEARGDQSVCWYDTWLKTGDRAFLAALLRYNEDDCRATYRLKEWLVSFLAEATS